MYAVIKTGGKQQKVRPGDVIQVELIHGGHDQSVSFTPVLVVDDDGKTHFGKDLGRAVVKAKVLGEEKGDKVKVFKYRPKTGYAKRQGHRQMYTLVEIEEVTLPKRPAPRKPAKATEASGEAVEAKPSPPEEEPQEAPAQDEA